MLYISLWVPCRCKSHAFLCIVITVVECIPMHSHFLPLRPANSPSSSCLSLRHTNADRVLHAIPTWKLSGLSSLPLMCSCRPWAFQISLPALRSCNPLVCCVAKRPLQGHALKAQRLLTQQPPLSHTLMLPHLAYSTSHAQPPPPSIFLLFFRCPWIPTAAPYSTKSTPPRTRKAMHVPHQLLSHSLLLPALLLPLLPFLLQPQPHSWRLPPLLLPEAEAPLAPKNTTCPCLTCMPRPQHG